MNNFSNFPAYFKKYNIITVTKRYICGLETGNSVIFLSYFKDIGEKIIFKLLVTFIL